MVSKTLKMKLRDMISQICWLLLRCWGFPGSSEVKASASNAGDPGLIPGSGRSPGEMVTHPSILAWGIPWTEKPGRLQSTGSQRVRHDWATSLHFTEMLRKGGTENLPLTLGRCKMLVTLKKIISVNGSSVTVTLRTNRMWGRGSSEYRGFFKMEQIPKWKLKRIMGSLKKMSIKAWKWVSCSVVSDSLWPQGL